MSLSPPITVFEHDLLRTDRGEKRLTEPQLKTLQAYYGDNGTPYYSLIHHGVKFCEYVGVIQIGSTVIEVLPKADKNQNPESDSAWREVLIGMLRAVGNFEIHAPSSSSLRVKSNSILDLYFELIITQAEYLLHRGLVKKYRKTEGNQKALKGSLQFNQQLNHNLAHKERFFVRYTTFDVDHVLHRILYKAIQLVGTLCNNQSLRSRIWNLLLNFPAMPDIRVSQQLFSKITYDRKTEGYRKAMEIAELLLLNYHPDVSRGDNHILALMFDMNKLWEQFVYVSLRKNLKSSSPGYSVRDQVMKRFWKSDKGSKSSVIPDIVVRKGKEDCIVLDTKWKNLNGYKPSPDDLRQMYVYHEYFNARKVALIYPGMFEATTGRYFDSSGNDGEQECSIFPVSVVRDIPKWQRAISNEVSNWMNARAK